MPPTAPVPACKAAAAAVGSQKPWLFVGLGNPGRMFKGTRHNIGFEMIDAIAEAEGISVDSKQFKAKVGKGLIGDVPVMLAKPQTYMNASGESVGQLVSYFKIPLDQLVVIYDDLDLPFAKLRLLPKGGHGGHNGMRSIIDHLKQSHDFSRLRIGIGRPQETGVINFVLGSFTKQEREQVFLLDCMGQFYFDACKFDCGVISMLVSLNGSWSWEAKIYIDLLKQDISNLSLYPLQMDVAIHRGLQAVRIMVMEGFNKGAIFVNTPQPPEMLNR